MIKIPISKAFNTELSRGNLAKEGLKLLVVDDEPIIRMGVMDTLSVLGFHFFEAGNGVEALEVLSNHDIQFILTDLAMPELNGMELLRRLGTQNRRIHKVVMSGHADQIISKQVQQLGVNHLLTKPVEDEELIAVFQRLIEEYGRAA